MRGEITEIRSESNRHAENNLWVWYDMQSPGDVTKRRFVPEVMYLGSGSEEKALRRWIARIFQNLGSQYTVGTFLWLWGILRSSSCLL